MIDIALIQFPGSNCERETRMAIERNGMRPIDVFWNEEACDLNHFSGFVIIGGFSYEDRGRAGLIASMSPLITQLKTQAKLGKPILGICNGAQIILESDLIPHMALTQNKQIGFHNSWVEIKPQNSHLPNAFTDYIDSTQPISIPSAHAEGCFVIPHDLLNIIEENGVVFKYTESQPNGSIHNIAAVCNKAGNIMAMMPHPERSENGDGIFESMRNYIETNSNFVYQNFEFDLPTESITKYQSNYTQIIIAEKITDNTAVSIQLALQQKNIKAKLRKYHHWEIQGDLSEQELKKIKSSFELYNPNKQFIYTKNIRNGFLVQDSNNPIGIQKNKILKNYYHLHNLNHIIYSTVWEIDCAEDELEKIQTILFNSISQRAYHYDTCCE